MANPVRFTVESTDIDAPTGFVLEDSDLPKDLPTGTKLRKTITRYAGTFTSVQVHGVEYDPIVLEGVFEDSWYGVLGHARDMRAIVDEVVELGELVRFEYDGLQYWGTLDGKTVEKDPHRVEYELRFEPYWRDDPRQSSYLAFAEPPNDLGESIDGRLGDAESFIQNAPDGISTAFVTTLILELASARNRVSSVLQYISNVADYADLTADQIGLVTRSLFAGIQTLNSTTERLRRAGTEILDDNAAAQLRGSEYVAEANRRVRLSIEDLVAMMRKFLDTTRPRRQRTHVVTQNDTLHRLAQIYLGDFGRWTEIADANDLDTTELVVGSSLLIPRR